MCNEDLVRCDGPRLGLQRHKHCKDVIHDWGLGYFDGNAVKYLSRWRAKGGVNDLLKARHYIDKLIELEHAQQKPDSP